MKLIQNDSKMKLDSLIDFDYNLKVGKNSLNQSGDEEKTFLSGWDNKDTGSLLKVHISEMTNGGIKGDTRSIKRKGSGFAPPSSNSIRTKNQGKTARFSIHKTGTEQSANIFKNSRSKNRSKKRIDMTYLNEGSTKPRG